MINPEPAGMIGPAPTGMISPGALVILITFNPANIRIDFRAKMFEWQNQLYALKFSCEKESQYNKCFLEKLIANMNMYFFVNMKSL